MGEFSLSKYIKAWFRVGGAWPYSKQHPADAVAEGYVIVTIQYYYFQVSTASNQWLKKPHSNGCSGSCTLDWFAGCTNAVHAFDYIPEWWDLFGNVYFKFDAQRRLGI